MIDPYIFQLKQNKVIAVTDGDQVKAPFQETSLTVAELERKLKAN